ncbi:hypothetical protein [Bacillus sp. SM2101]|uniref:hypothetical protein n=1 Tax=Bacillus sp. SM2101 TaxID=2805366 RepID=UPI001BDDEA0A|nr:hypothetical protein [Bacillus sp. SM2101]
MIETFPNLFLLTILVTWTGDRSIFAVLQEGMLVKGKVYKWEQFNCFNVPRMSRWHEYAGIHDRKASHHPSFQKNKNSQYSN